MAIDGSIRAEVQAYTAKQGVDAPIAEAVRQEGRFQGQTVQEVDVNSAAQDAAEEMTFAAAETVEKKLSERKAGSKEALHLSAAELPQEVNATAESQQNRQLHEFMDGLKGLPPSATEADIRQLVGEHFKDASDQYEALEHAAVQLQKEGGQEELLAKLTAAKGKLMEQAGPAIRAGLNIAADVLRYAGQGSEGTEALRTLYRFSILGGQSVTSISTSIMDRYGPAQFTQTLEFLLRAAGSDLDGKIMGSSLEKPQLKSAIDDIYHVQALGNTFKSLGDLLQKTQQLFAG